MRWLFGEHVLDVERRELRRAGTLVAIEPQVFDLLVHLIRNRGRVVSKDDLLGSVWGGRIVSDSALANRINAARVAVGDNGEDQKLLRTLPKKGFRFIGTVTEEAAQPAQVFRSTDSKLQLPLPEQPSLVVLPFTDMNPERNESHFADGITEDLITELARIRWLFVIARNSAFTYKDRPVDVKQISRELGVRYVLEGSVRRSGQRMRINAQLVDATSGIHQWAERYDRDAGEIFAVQDEITSSVAAAVEPHLLVAEGNRAYLSQDELSAWQLVARAQGQYWRLTKEDFDASITSLAQALEGSPDFGPAHALMGFALGFAAHMGWVDRGEWIPVARRHAERAIALDDRNPWGYSALGYAAMMQRRTEESLAAFRKAVDLTPSSAAAHGHLSHGLAFAGFADDAIKHGEIAMKLSPLDPAMARFMGGMAIAHYTARRFEETIKLTRDNLRLRPGFQGAQRLHCASLAQAGRIQEARAYLATIRQTHRPILTIEWVRNNVPYQTPELMELFIEGLRKAGLDD